jgi:hypothetical protein
MRPGVAVVLSVFAATLLAAPARAQVPPAAPTPTLTKAQAETGFYLDVARCLFSLEHGQDIAALPDQIKMDLRPATAPERFLFKDLAIKVWTTDAFGSHVLLAERAAGRCDVVADQLPVDATFQMVMERLRQADPELKPYPVKPGYNPIAYGLERVIGGSRYVVHLEGAEPSGAAGFLRGHVFRFSLLNAWVVRQPQDARPMFR